MTQDASPDLLLCQRSSEGVSRAVAVDGQNLFVILHRFRFVAGLLAGLREQAQDKRIFLIGLLQLRNCSLVIFAVERDIASDVRIEARLVRIAAFVEDGLGGREMLLRFFLPALPRSDSRQRAFPAELPKVFLGWCPVWYHWKALSMSPDSR